MRYNKAHNPSSTFRNFLNQHEDIPIKVIQPRKSSM